jgi:hypothetical protein
LTCGKNLQTGWGGEGDEMSQQYQKCHLFICILHLSLPNLIEEKMWNFEVLQILL